MSQTRSSYEPTRLAAGQAATTAPTGPWDQPWAMFAVRVAAGQGLLEECPSELASP